MTNVMAFERCRRALEALETAARTKPWETARDRSPSTNLRGRWLEASYIVSGMDLDDFAAIERLAATLARGCWEPEMVDRISQSHAVQTDAVGHSGFCRVVLRDAEEMAVAIAIIGQPAKDGHWTATLQYLQVGCTALA